MKKHLDTFVYPLVTLAIFMLCITPIHAQSNNRNNKGTAERHAQRQTENMAQVLNLDKPQQRLIYDINLRHARENQEAISTIRDNQFRYDKLRHIQNLKDEEFKIVLSKQQYADYLKIKDQLILQAKQRYRKYN